MVLKIVLSWSRQIQFGTHGSCSFSLPLHKPTPGPNHLTVLSRRRWKHMTILMMVIIEIIVIIVIMEVIKIIEVIDIIAFILVGWDQLVRELSSTTKIRYCTLY
jgi:hypothetical protein